MKKKYSNLEQRIVTIILFSSALALAIAVLSMLINQFTNEKEIKSKLAKPTRHYSGHVLS